MIWKPIQRLDSSAPEIPKAAKGCVSLALVISEWRESQTSVSEQNPFDFYNQ